MLFIVKQLEILLADPRPEKRPRIPKVCVNIGLIKEKAVPGWMRRSL